MKAGIRQQALELGFEECRFTTAAAPESARHFRQWLDRQYHGGMAYLQRQASQRIDPQRLLPGARTIIVLAVGYAGMPFNAARPPAASLTDTQAHPSDHGTSPGIAPRPAGLVAGYARHDDYHHLLGARLERLIQWIHQQTGPAVCSRGFVDAGPVLERDLAQRAGLGFIGKHTNLVSRRYGNWLLLAEILTTLELAPDPSERNRCGICSRCLSACPTQALVAPFQLDARKCISYLTIENKGPIPEALRPAVGTRIFGCDECLAACPWNRMARTGKLMSTQERRDLGTLDLLDLLALDIEGFRKRFAGTPLERTRRRGLVRNACVALGNAGDERSLAALDRLARDPDPLLGEHAGWAANRIRNRMLTSPE